MQQKGSPIWRAPATRQRRHLPERSDRWAAWAPGAPSSSAGRREGRAALGRRRVAGASTSCVHGPEGPLARSRTALPAGVNRCQQPEVPRDGEKDPGPHLGLSRVKRKISLGNSYKRYAFEEGRPEPITSGSCKAGTAPTCTFRSEPSLAFLTLRRRQTLKCITHEEEQGGSGGAGASGNSSSALEGSGGRVSSLDSQPGCGVRSGPARIAPAVGDNRSGGRGRAAGQEHAVRGSRGECTRRYSVDYCQRKSQVGGLESLVRVGCSQVTDSPERRHSLGLFPGAGPGCSSWRGRPWSHLLGPTSGPLQLRLQDSEGA